MFEDYNNYVLAGLFNELSGREIHDKPNPNFMKGILSQYQLLVSEFNEFEMAWNCVIRDDPECLDGLVDMNYILYGTYKYMGIDPSNINNECSVKFTNCMKTELDSLRGLFGIYELAVKGMMNPEEITFDNIKLILMGINLRVLNIAKVLGYNYNEAFKIVHEANMSKFCETEDQAIQSVEYYKTSSYNNEYRYPDYRLSPDGNYYIVFNNDQSDQPLNAGKILKNIHWKEPNLKKLFIKPCLNTNKLSNGGITLIIGPMFSDKTNKLFSLYDKHILMGYKCLIIKYIKDNRFGSNDSLLVTHDGKNRPAIASDNLDSDYNGYDALFIDEIQFFNIDFDLIIELSKTKKIFLAGLSGDYMRKPFDNISNLIPLASKIITVRAICLKNGKKAAFTKRLNNNKERIVIGDKDIYEPVDLENYFPQ